MFHTGDCKSLAFNMCGGGSWFDSYISHFFGEFMKEEWITWKGTAQVDGDITHLTADDSSDPNEKLYMDSCDVRIEKNVIKIRVGAIMQGFACKI